MTGSQLDNPEGLGPPPSDAHGRAALLLVESLLHGLIARNVILTADAAEIIAVATEVRAEIADDLGESPETLRRSLALIEAVGASIAIDLPPAGPAAAI